MSQKQVTPISFLCLKRKMLDIKNDFIKKDLRMMWNNHF